MVNDNYAHCIVANSPWIDEIAKRLVDEEMISKESFDRRDLKKLEMYNTKFRNKNIFTMVIKDRQTERNNLKDLYEILTRLKRTLIDKGIHSCAFSKTSPGIEGLEWRIIKKLFYYIFADTAIKITLSLLKKFM